MELIATARFKKAMDRAEAAKDYTDRITQIVTDIADTGAAVSHPLLEQREKVEKAEMLILTSNRGLCGGYNSSVIRAGLARRNELNASMSALNVDVSGKRGIAALNFRDIPIDETYTEFEDDPAFLKVAAIADGYIEKYMTGQIDRLDVVYTEFVSSSRQNAVIQTLLPLGTLATESTKDKPAAENAKMQSDYEFLPSAGSILEEVVPASFRVRLFKCFLDAAVSEQISRMIAMKSATENAGDMIKSLSMTFNRARQSKITGEIMEIIGGVEALG
jgi:F-type H+-transporting ATPase subunit gamma